MYLHEIAENELSFTKEDMHAGKHAEYEKKLIENLFRPPSQPSQLTSIRKIRAPVPCLVLLGGDINHRKHFLRLLPISVNCVSVNVQSHS